MATPSEVYYAFGEAIATHLGVKFLVAIPKLGRPKAVAEGMSLALPVVFPGENVRYGSGVRVDLELIVTAQNKHDVLQMLDSVVEWIKLNRNSLAFELLLTGANPYYQGDEQSPELVGYAFDVTANL